MAPSVPPTILIIRFSSIGDLLLTTPLLRALRLRHPAARITFVVREDLAETLRHNPRIDDLVSYRRGDSLRELARQLRRRQAWTHRLDLHGSLRSFLLRRLVGGAWHGYPKRRRRRRQLIRTHRRRGGDLGPVAERYFAAAAGLDVVPDEGGLEFYTTREAENEADGFLAAHGIGRNRGVIAMAPGAAHFTKRWPERHWAELVERTHRERDVVILGGAAEQELGLRLAAGRPGVVSAAGQFSLTGTAALLKRARLLVAGDTGVLHLATAVGTPVVGLYGPTVREFGFFPYHARAATLELDLPCRPCSSQGSSRCPLGHHRCLVDLTPDRVVEALRVPPR
jgi:heptosyltransferase-2